MEFRLTEEQEIFRDAVREFCARNVVPYAAQWDRDEAFPAETVAALGEMGALHPEEPHWYLFSIGVDPHHQGEGLGSLLMEHALPMSDADGTIAYLESSNPRNVPFYQRHGFEVMHVVQIGSSPTFTLMARQPR